MKILLTVVEECATERAEAAIGRIHAAFADSRLEIVFLRIISGGEDARPLPPTASFGGVRAVELVFGQALDYGERTKLAMDYALREKTEALVILDGEFRYPIEEIGELVRSVIDDGADMALAIPKKKRSGDGRPAFKVQPGARFAARLVNALTSARLSGWHCGFRAYRTAALARIPYAYNSNCRMFNTEIIIQFLLCGLVIDEVPSVGYRHRRLGLGAKIRFGMQMLRASALSVLHRMSLFYQRQYDVTAPIDVYGLKLGYRSSHTAALSKIPDGARVLDIGCGDGALAALLKKRGCQVRGLDRHQSLASCALDGYMCIDLDVRSHSFDARGYDKILLLDVLEHLRFPELLLDHLRANCGSGNKPLLIISIPNVAFFIIRARLLLGSFHYGKLGILDLTHCRLFTEGSIRNLLTRSGYAIESVEGIPAPYPKAIGLNAASRLLLLANQAFIRVSRGLFSYQLLLTARPRPTLEDGLKAGKTQESPSRPSGL